MEFESSRPFWNKHVLKDRILLGMLRLLSSNKKYFEDSIESPPFEQHLKGISFDLPEFQGEGMYEVEVETGAGSMDAGIKIHR